MHTASLFRFSRFSAITGALLLLSLAAGMLAYHPPGAAKTPMIAKPFYYKTNQNQSQSNLFVRKAG
jgi:hypothetical protein